ncbi:dienelactone hydrolase family protein [Actibacterium sp. D379-3]
MEHPESHLVSLSADAGTIPLSGDLVRPANAVGLVLFAHGSGSSRLSPRNRQVAAALQRRGLATLLFDLLTEEEAADRANVFDIPLLGRRVAAAIGWAAGDERVADLPVGLFGASTGAAAALMPGAVAAVVSRGGRPDLAGNALPQVTCPTLLIVGGADFGVIELNEAALARLTCEKRLAIVPGATHLFEEPGTLAAVSALAADWFATHLRAESSKR